ncbi:UNVERIFIED_CONTAM: type I restriction-modification system subunit M N-terminal domain-containing protein [Spiribacter pallidus]
MRGAMDSGEYEHGALGLLFLRYVPAGFEVKRQDLINEVADQTRADESARLDGPKQSFGTRQLYKYRRLESG